MMKDQVRGPSGRIWEILNLDLHDKGYYYQLVSKEFDYDILNSFFTSRKLSSSDWTLVVFNIIPNGSLYNVLIAFRQEPTEEFTTEFKLRFA